MVSWVLFKRSVVNVTVLSLILLIANFHSPLSLGRAMPNNSFTDRFKIPLFHQYRQALCISRTYKQFSLRYGSKHWPKFGQRQVLKCASNERLEHVLRKNCGHMRSRPTVALLGVVWHPCMPHSLYTALNIPCISSLICIKRPRFKEMSFLHATIYKSIFIQVCSPLCGCTLFG
jgi:hypothetical protein